MRNFRVQSAARRRRSTDDKPATGPVPASHGWGRAGPGLSSESPGIRPAPAPGSLPYQQGESLHPGGRRLDPTRRPAGPSAGQLPVDRRREFRRRRAARVDPVSNGPGAVPTRRTISCLHGPMKCDLYFI